MYTIPAICLNMPAICVCLCNTTFNVILYIHRHLGPSVRTWSPPTSYALYTIWTGISILQLYLYMTRNWMVPAIRPSPSTRALVRAILIEWQVGLYAAYVLHDVMYCYLIQITLLIYQLIHIYTHAPIYRGQRLYVAGVRLPLPLAQQPVGA